MGQKIKAFWAELWAAALRPTLQARWKSMTVWALGCGIGLPYAWYDFHRAMAPVFENFLRHPPETQQQIIQDLYAMPAPLWAALGINTVMVFGFVWACKALFAPLHLEKPQEQARTALHHEKEPV